uniref:Starch synthase, chloroplastic/amyloplastic n=1 Tax=Chlamydomonas euryale TaxID=1486919 RepID=A0A7R9YVB8_9CHLO
MPATHPTFAAGIHPHGGKGDGRGSSVRVHAPPEVVDAQPTVEQFEAMRLEMQALREENERLRAKLGEVSDGESSREATKRVQKEWEAEAQATPRISVAEATLEVLNEGIRWPRKDEQRFWDRAPRYEPRPVEGGQGAGGGALEKDTNPLHIIHITAEMAPIAKVGGLGDVVTGLAKSCMARGHNVAVIMPFYSSLPTDQIEGLKHERDIDVPKGFSWDGEFRISSLRTSVYWGRIAGVPTYLLRPANWDECNIFKGGRIYGGSYDEREAYLYMCRAALEFLKESGMQPDVLQLHDWHAAATALLYWECYHNEGLSKPKVMLTIHNLENTGEVRQDEFAATGMYGEAFATIDKALDERTIGHNPERLNLMKGGIVFSNAVTTVSPTYAAEVKSGGAAGWLKGLFEKPEVKQKFFGILNGIDAQEWDPATDTLLAANYSAAAPVGKRLCKEYLQRGLGLDIDPNRPLVAVVSRLVPQKGIHLIKSAVYRTVAADGQFVLLGSGHADGVFKGMAESEFNGHPHCRLMVMYSERLAHMIYAAADIVLVPSMFEPCGLTQLIALRYGAVPVVRATGGLADTVFDVDQASGVDAARRNGFSFGGSDEASLFSALDRALAMYRERRGEWEQLSLRNMQANVSWSESAKSYVDVYRRL